MKCRRARCQLKAYSERLCFAHFREANGFRFDPELGKFVPRSSTAHSDSTQARRGSPPAGTQVQHNALLPEDRFLFSS